MMQYKLLIVKNRYSKSLDFKKGLEWFKANTPLEIITEELITDFDVTTEKINNATYSGVICGDDIYPKLRTVIPEGKYHAVVFVYGNSLNGIRVNASKAYPLYPGTDLIQLSTLNDGGKSLNHEIFHTLFHRLQRQQIMVEDCMDSVIVNEKIYAYYNNDDLNASHSNRSIAMERISPYWDKVGNILVLSQPSTIPSALSSYIFFSPAEVQKFKLVPELWSLMDKIRGLSGVSIIGTSGRRTIAENIAVGGQPNSAHLRGLAFDWVCTDNFKRTKYIKAIIECGVPVFLEIAKKHIHLDIDASIHALGQTIPSEDN